MAALEPYYFEPSTFQTPYIMIALKIVKWIIAWKHKKRNRFSWPCEGCQVCSWFLSFPPISSRTGWRHTINTAWLPAKTVSKCRPPKSLLSRRIFSGYRVFRGWKFSEGKCWMFTCYRRRQKVSFLEWPPLIKISRSLSWNFWTSLSVEFF